MTCKECNSRNPIGNKFCRECGAKLILPEGSLAAEEAARAEQERRVERAAVLLADANLLAEQGKYLGAIPIAEEVIQIMPQSTSAYSLLVTLYEHTDQQEKAISAQEQVVALNPGSPADTVRLERLQAGERTSPPPVRPARVSGVVPTLRNGTVPTSGAPYPSQIPSWFPVAAGITGGGLVVFMLLLLVTPGSNGKVVAKDGSSFPSPAPINSPDPYNGLYPTQPPASDPNRADPFVPLDNTRRALQEEAARRNGNTATPNNTNTANSNRSVIASTGPTTGTLPFPNRPIGGSSQRSVAPATIPQEIINAGPPSTNDNSRLPTIQVAPPQNNGGDTGNGNSGNSDRIDAGPPTDTAQQTEQSRNSYMRISVGPPRNKPEAITAAPPASSESTGDLDGDPMRRARSLQSLGRYRDAIGAYREAISSGSSAGEAQQGVGLCYQRLGDNSSAKNAYKQAISAYESQIASGQNVNAAQRGLNSSKTALEVLGSE